MAAVDVESLTITYGNVTAVDDLSFQAEAGEVTCVLGPNGAGKTSTLESLEGLRRPSAGRLRVIGLDPRTDHGALTERIGVMLQEGGIHPAVRVREVLRHAAALYPNPLDPGGLIERLGLAGLERRTYRQLSGGEQQRLALALALVGRPQVAFLDEPTAGVDPAGRQVIRQVVADLRNDGVAVLLTTHDLDEAERVADRVVIIVGGRLVGAGTVDDLTRASGGDEQVRFRAAAGLDRDSLVRHLGGATVVEVAPGEYVVTAEPTPQVVAAITAWLADHDQPLADLRAGRQRLEDVYLRLTAVHAEAARTARSRTGSPRRGRRGRLPRRDEPARTAGEHDDREHDGAAEPDGAAEHDDAIERDHVDLHRDDPAVHATNRHDTDPPHPDTTDHRRNDRDHDSAAEPDHVDPHRDDTADHRPTHRDVTEDDETDPLHPDTVGHRWVDRGHGGAAGPDHVDPHRDDAAGPPAAAPVGVRREASTGTGVPDAAGPAPDEPRAGRSRDEGGLTPSTFEAFWGRGRFRGDADQADDPSWEGWADAPGDRDRTPASGDPDNRSTPDDLGSTSAAGRPDRPRRGWRRRR